VVARPRHQAELAHQEALLPAAEAVPFGPVAAALAAELYRAVRRARQRVFDLGVAACALASGAALWTLNAEDFRDIPGLGLFES
jgi:predicted nucleic acid-binding protein